MLLLIGHNFLLSMYLTLLMLELSGVKAQELIKSWLVAVLDQRLAPMVMRLVMMVMLMLMLVHGSGC